MRRCLFDIVDKLVVHLRLVAGCPSMTGTAALAPATARVLMFCEPLSLWWKGLPSQL